MGRWFDPSAPLPPSATVAPVEKVYVRIFQHMALFKGGITASIVFAMLSSLFIALQPWPIKFIIDGVLVDDVLDLGPLGDIASDTSDVTTSRSRSAFMPCPAPPPRSSRRLRWPAAACPRVRRRPR